MDYATAMFGFAAQWKAIQGELLKARPAERSADRLSPTGVHKKIGEIETAAFFAAVGRAMVSREGEISSVALINTELADLKEDLLEGVDLTQDRIKSLKDRIRKRHLAQVNALSHFGLFEKFERTGSSNTLENWYRITPSGRSILARLEGKES